MKRRHVIIALCVLVLGSFGCKKDQTAGGTTRYNVRMTDAPADYDAVIVNIKEIEIKISGQSDVTMAVNKKINLLDLSNGKDTLLASSDLPSGAVSQIRLILEASGNEVIIDGQTFQLETPSAQQSGLKLNVHQELTVGVEYTVKLDFDAAKSIVETGNGKYILKPVIRVLAEAVSGAIKGVVSPTNAHPAILAINGSDTVGTYADSVSGKFLIQGLAAGTYSVLFDASSGYKDTTIHNVPVTIGEVTDIGIVAF